VIPCHGFLHKFEEREFKCWWKSLTKSGSKVDYQTTVDKEKLGGSIGDMASTSLDSGLAAPVMDISTYMSSL